MKAVVPKPCAICGLPPVLGELICGHTPAERWLPDLSRTKAALDAYDLEYNRATADLSSEERVNAWLARVAALAADVGAAYGTDTAGSSARAGRLLPGDPALSFVRRMVRQWEAERAQ